MKVSGQVLVYGVSIWPFATGFWKCSDSVVFIYHFSIRVLRYLGVKERTGYKNRQQYNDKCKQSNSTIVRSTRNHINMRLSTCSERDKSIIKVLAIRTYELITIHIMIICSWFGLLIGVWHQVSSIFEQYP